MSSDIIMGALSDAGVVSDDGGSVDTSSMDSMGNTVTTPDPVETIGDESSSLESSGVETKVDTPEPLAVKPEEKTEQDEVDRLLEEAGIKAPIAGQRENRIPYSQTRKIIANAKVKWQKDYDATIASERVQFTKASEENQRWRASEQLASSDPDRYVATLAALDPRYQKFLQQAQTPQTTKADEDPMPQPTKADDGTVYYTPEDFQKLMEWNRRQAVRESNEAYEKKYGGILGEQQRQAQARAVYEARLPQVRSQIARIKNTYGEALVNEHQQAMVDEMKKAEAAGDPITAAEAAAIVLTPLLKADETKLREKWMKELKQRPAVASSTTPGARRSESEAPTPGDTKAIIMDAIRPYIK